MSKDFKEEAEAHWEYTESVIREYQALVSGDPEWIPFNSVLKLCKFFYVAAMVHGYKHGRDDREEKE